LAVAPLEAKIELERRDLVVDGIRVAVFEGGTGEPCLLLHGYPESHRCWRRVVPELSKSRRVFAPDWFGWGASERSLAVNLDYDSEVERIGKLLDELGLGRVDLVGHDYGGFLSLGFAIRHPERVRRLAVLNSRAQRTFSGISYFQFGTLSFLAGSPLFGWLFDLLPHHAIHASKMRRYVANGAFSTDELDGYIGWLKEREGKRWFHHYWSFYRVDPRPELAVGAGRLAMPTALIWGDRDPYLPFEIAEELAASIPGARLTRIAGGDHYIVEERPAEVVVALQELLGRPAP